MSLEHRISTAHGRLFRQNYLFAGLDTKALDHLHDSMHHLKVPAGEVILRENTPGPNRLYIICSGVVAIFKSEAVSEELHRLAPHLKANQQIARLREGDSFGEMSFLGADLPSATVQAETDVELLWVDIKDLDALTAEDQKSANHLLFNLGRKLASRIREANRVTVAELQAKIAHATARNAMGRFIIFVVMLQFFYNLTLNVTADLSRLSFYAGTLVSVGLILIFAVFLTIMIRKSGRPFRDYGLTRDGAWDSVKFSLLCTLPILLGFTVIKWGIVSFSPAHQHLSVFDPFTDNPWMDLMDYAVYGIFSPMQEFIARCAMQSSLQRFYTGKRSVFYAILVSNAFFSMSHIHLSPVLALVVFFPGLFWGWMFSKRPNLAGVALSHTLIGWWGLFVLNFSSLFGGLTVPYE